MSPQKQSHQRGPSRPTKKSSYKVGKSTLRNAIEAIKKLKLENSDLRTELANQTADFWNRMNNDAENICLPTNMDRRLLDHWISSTDGTVLLKLQRLLRYIAHPDIPNLIQGKIFHVMSSIAVQMADAGRATASNFLTGSENDKKSDFSNNESTATRSDEDTVENDNLSDSEEDIADNVEQSDSEEDPADNVERTHSEDDSDAANDEKLDTDEDNEESDSDD